MDTPNTEQELIGSILEKHIFWEKGYNEFFNDLFDTGRAFNKGYDDYEFWIYHDSMKAFIAELLRMEKLRIWNNVLNVNYEFGHNPNQALQIISEMANESAHALRKKTY